MQLLTGINHVAIMTEDLDRFTAFYTDVLEASVVFEETNPQFRHAILAVGGTSVLHPVQMAESKHARASSTMMDRGHLDHLALDVPSREAFDEVRRRLVGRGASDGAITDLGPKLSFWFVDPDGMHIEVDWVRDPSLQGFHAPTPVDEALH
ncbi:MAG: VOC family protein [Actinomycetota bacterium]|nr:VOC family protein [Actinomycetota bacterium]